MKPSFTRGPFGPPGDWPVHRGACGPSLENEGTRIPLAVGRSSDGGCAVRGRKPGLHGWQSQLGSTSESGASRAVNFHCVRVATKEDLYRFSMSNDNNEPNCEHAVAVVKLLVSEATREQLTESRHLLKPVFRRCLSNWQMVEATFCDGWLRGDRKTWQTDVAAPPGCEALFCSFSKGRGCCGTHGLRGVLQRDHTKMAHGYYTAL